MASTAPIVADELYSELERTLKAAAADTETLYQAIVDAPFEHDRDMAFLFLGFLSFFVLDPKSKMIIAGAATDNDYYKQSIANYDFCLEDYKIPLSAKENSVVQAITTGKPVGSDNWDSFRRPKIEEGVARLNQANSGIGYTSVYPVEGTVKGALMFNYYQFPEELGVAQEVFMERYATIVSRVLSNT